MANKQELLLLAVKRAIEANFTEDNWIELGLLTGCDDFVSKHPRLLRSLSWGDPDYPGCILGVLKNMIKRHENN